MANETSHDDPKFWIQSLQSARVVVLKVRLGRDNRTQTNMNLT